MLNLKKTAVAVLALGSSAVFAGSMGPICTPGSVTVPCAKTAWDIAAQALYLRPTYSGSLPYATAVGGTSTTTYTGVQPNWGWGFKIEGSYHFNTGNDIDVNWYRVHNSNTVTVPYSTATTENIYMNPQWDAVNIEFGQHVDFGEQSNIRFHGGLAFARIETQQTYYGISTGNSWSGTLKYNGIGPRIGADMSYDIGDGFGVYANGAGALFVGNNAFNTTTTLNSTGVVTGGTNGSINQVVPEIEAKLGGTYMFAMAQGDLSIDAGWMWVNYFNAQNATYTTTANTGPVQTLASSNFGLQGPYIGLKWIGNV